MQEYKPKPIANHENNWRFNQPEVQAATARHDEFATLLRNAPGGSQAQIDLLEIVKQFELCGSSTDFSKYEKLVDLIKRWDSAFNDAAHRVWLYAPGPFKFPAASNGLGPASSLL